MNFIEKLLIFMVAVIFGLIVYVIFIVYNTENITINGITYYCEGNYSYYYEDLGSATAYIPTYIGKALVYMPVIQSNSVKRTLDYNICDKQDK